MTMKVMSDPLRHCLGLQRDSQKHRPAICLPSEPCSPACPRGSWLHVGLWSWRVPYRCACAARRHRQFGRTAPAPCAPVANRPTARGPPRSKRYHRPAKARAAANRAKSAAHTSRNRPGSGAAYPRSGRRRKAASRRRFSVAIPRAAGTVRPAACPPGN